MSFLCLFKRHRWQFRGYPDGGGFALYVCARCQKTERRDRSARTLSVVLEDLENISNLTGEAMYVIIEIVPGYPYTVQIGDDIEHAAWTLMDAAEGALRQYNEDQT